MTMIDEAREALLWNRFLSVGWRDNHQARTIFAMLLDAARHGAGGVVLDAGAGRQRYRPLFEETSLYLAQEHPMALALKGMPAGAYDMLVPVDECIPLREECVDVVISTVVLEHLRYPERFFAEAFRVLKPGGRLYVQAPLNYPEQEQPHDYQRPTRYGLRRWYEDTGFVDVAVVADSSDSVSASSFLLPALKADLEATGRAAEWEALRPELEVLVARVWDLTDDAVHAGSTYPVGWCSSGAKPGVASVVERRCPDPGTVGAFTATLERLARARVARETAAQASPS